MAAKTRVARKRRTRERLLRAARDLFAENGILMTRTLDISERARVAHGTVFLHFLTRDDLIAAAVEESAGQAAGRIHMLARGKLTVRQVLETHVEGLRPQEAFYARLVMEGPMLPPYARSRLIVIQSAIAVYFARAAKREMASGKLRRMPVGLLFNTWLGLLHHYICNRDLFSPGEAVLAARGAALVEHYLALIKS